MCFKKKFSLFSVVIQLSLTMILAMIGGQTLADWQHSAYGTVKYVRSYPVGGTGLRAQISVAGADHNCGQGPTTYYFDSPLITTDVVKTITALATTAMLAGKKVMISYDCDMGHSGFGWGTALQIEN